MRVSRNLYRVTFSNGDDLWFENENRGLAQDHANYCAAVDGTEAGKVHFIRRLTKSEIWNDKVEAAKLWRGK